MNILATRLPLRPALRLVALALLCGAVSAWTACDRANAADTRASAATVSRDTISDSLLLARADRGRVMGSDSAPIWIVMISDFQCPYCRVFHDSTLRSVQQDYVQTGKARLAMLNLPLPQHPHSRTAAIASLCAAAQGKFWPVADSIFASQEAMSKTADAAPLFDRFMREQGGDMAEFARCRKSQAIQQLLQRDIQQAEQASVQSTPSFFIGNFMVAGAAPYAQFRKVVDTALIVAKKAKSP